MKSRCIVLSSKTFAIEEIINHKKNGFIIDPKNIKKLIMLKKKIKFSEFKKMSCYSYLGLLVPYINYSFKEIKDNCWYEINTLDDYKKALTYKF